MKIAIAGKGGVGKTTLASLLARIFASQGHKVLAIDADPDANLAAAIGVPQARLSDVKPIAAMREIAEERTGHGGGFGGFFKLNPSVEDLPDALSVTHEGVRVLAIGSIEHGGSGCVCPEHTLLRALMSHIIMRRGDVVIMDMEAGVEHLGRATADGVDALIIVVEPGRRSLETATQIERLAADIGLKHLAYVGSKVDGRQDEEFLTKALPEGKYLGSLSLSQDLRKVDMQGLSPFDAGGLALEEAGQIKKRLEAFVSSKTNPKSGADICA